MSAPDRHNVLTFTGNCRPGDPAKAVGGPATRASITRLIGAVPRDDLGAMANFFRDVAGALYARADSHQESLAARRASATRQNQVQGARSVIAVLVAEGQTDAAIARHGASLAIGGETVAYFIKLARAEEIKVARAARDRAIVNAVRDRSKAEVAADIGVSRSTVSRVIKAAAGKP